MPGEVTASKQTKGRGGEIRPAQAMQPVLRIAKVWSTIPLRKSRNQNSVVERCNLRKRSNL